ncbi:hypothetical protein LZY01_13210 [Levilactobacillus zymae]|uniref:O-antigen ligase-related domain-containing protein n=1 Tax=Levilactobacillus zymae TaxID=267363 RepID=A0ABQ0X3P4_9LACO|nr:O-antigen ligase family protein [Levilactobacillus zymae]KRL13145.1 hypothetical protein FD38_GL001270 [Levilactobacillus zymae DSM 19395]QFR61158.1 hypothetical protein LZ395_06345 [Levilactobacillus zymae]GEO72153.1 hypothetical protein LZY01_13210 [Levilactobacillus zymae]
MNRKKATYSYMLVFFEYFYMFVTLLQCNSVLFCENNNSGKIKIVWVLLTALFLLRAVLRFVILKRNIQPLIWFVLLFLLLVISFLAISYQIYAFSMESMVSYLFIPIAGTIVMYDYFTSGAGGRLLVVFRNIVLCLAVLSLFFWLLSILGVPTNSESTIAWGTEHSIPGYFHIHFIAQGSVNFLGIDTIRNTGIFVEAPMYSYILSLAFLINLFVSKSGYNWITLTLGIALLTTTSTTGVIIAFLAVAYYEFVVVDRESAVLKVLIFLVGISALIFSVIRILSDKIDPNWNSSSSIRFNDIVAGFLAWKDHPWMGNGLGNYTTIIQYMDSRRLIGLTGYSSGAMEVLAYGGVLGLMFYVIPTVLSLVYSKRILGLSLISFVLFVFTIVDGTYIYLLLLCYFWAGYLTRKTNVK